MRRGSFRRPGVVSCLWTERARVRGLPARCNLLDGTRFVFSNHAVGRGVTWGEPLFWEAAFEKMVPLDTIVGRVYT